MMSRQHHAIQVVRKLLGIDVGTKVSFLDRGNDDPRQNVEPAFLNFDETVANRTGPVVELDRCSHEEAAAREGTFLRPFQPALKKGTNPGLAPRGCESGLHDALDETSGRIFQDLKLQRFLGLEMGEEAALGKIEILREPADAQSLETDLAGEADRVLEDGLAGQLSLAHSLKIVRPFVLVKENRKV